VTHAPRAERHKPWYLKQIPRTFLTEKNLTSQERSDTSPLHVAAFGGFLDQIPQQILNEKNLTLGSCGITPIYQAALGAADLSRIPQEFLTEKNLTTPGDYGCTPLYYLLVQMRGGRTKPARRFPVLAAVPLYHLIKKTLAAIEKKRKPLPPRSKLLKDWLLAVAREYLKTATTPKRNLAI